ncbi:MAG: META domain-containing protein [Calditrichaeota bacterium]|nr:META domain-containing protein [Calditrichota bacterium]
MKQFFTLTILLIGAILFFLLSCEKFYEVLDQKYDLGILLNHLWKLEKITDLKNETILTPDEKWEYSVVFYDNDSLKIVNACNQGEGFFKIQDNNNIEISVSCTEMACDSHPIYLGYCDDMGFAYEYRVSSDKLYIYINKGGRKYILIHRLVK